MNDMVMTIDYHLLPLGTGELLKEEATMLTTGWGMISYIDCEPTPLIRVQGATDVVTCGLPALWLFYFCDCGHSMIAFPDLRIIRQV